MTEIKNNGHLLEINELVKSYDGKRVVDGVCMRVKRGEVVGLLGQNGAGKTTTFYMIVGEWGGRGGRGTAWGIFPRSRRYSGNLLLRKI